MILAVVLSLLLASTHVSAGGTRTPTITPTGTRTPSPTVTPTPSSTPTPTGTDSFIPTTTITLTKTFLQVTYVNPDVLVKGILQPLQIVCQANCTTNETVYLTSTSCGSPDSIPQRTATTTNATKLEMVDKLNFTATFDTTGLTPGVFVICWGRKNSTWSTEWVNTGIPVTVVEFINVFPDIIPKARSQNLTIVADPSSVIAPGTQIYLSSVGCIRYRNPVIVAREETSPVSDFGGSFYTVAAQGLRESSQYDDIYSVCFRMNPTHGYIDTGLRVRVAPTFIVALNTTSVGRGSGQNVTFTCVGCTTSNRVYISSTGCLTTTASPAQTKTSTPQANVLSLGNGLFEADIDTSGTNLGIYSFCWRASDTSAWKDTFLDLTVRATPVADIQPRVIAKAAGQILTLTCSEGCDDGDLIYLTLGTCQKFVSAGAAGTDQAYLLNKTTSVNAASLNPSPTYKVCFKAAGSLDYLDTGLTVKVTGSNVIAVSRNSISKKFNQKIQLNCCETCDSTCNQGDFAYLTQLACSVDATDPLESTTTTTTRVELDADNAVLFDISLLIVGSFRLCYRPRDGIYSDTFITIFIRATNLVAVAPTDIPRVPRSILTFECTQQCLDDSIVYLTLDPCTNMSVISPTTSNTTNITGSAAPINTTNLIPGNNYKVCFQERGTYDSLDSGLSIFVRNTPIKATAPEAISKAAAQTITVTCVEGCADGDFIYITSSNCGTTSTDPIPSQDTSPKAVLSSNAVQIDASGLLPQTGYKICYRAPGGMWADSNFTLIVRSTALAAVTPGAVVKAQLQQLSFVCGATCNDGDLIFLTNTFCDPQVPNPTVSENNTAPITLTSLIASFDASPLKVGFYTICYRPATGMWINSTLWVQVTSTPVYAVDPSAIRKSLNQALRLSCTTGGCADGDYVYLTSLECRTDAIDPVGTAQSTTKTRIVSYTASIDSTGLLATTGSQTYKLCYRAASGNWLDSFLTVIVRPTSLTIANPSRIIKRSNQIVHFNCTQDCTTADRVQLSSGDCSATSTPLTASTTASNVANLTEASAVFDASALVAPMTYKVCYSLLGGDFVDSTVEIKVWPTNVVDVTPTTLQKGANQVLSVTCTGCSSTDRIYLTNGACAATAPTSSASDSASILLVSQLLNIDATLLEGEYKICYSNGNAFVDTTLLVNVIDNLPKPTRTPTPPPRTATPLPPVCNNPVNGESRTTCVDDDTIDSYSRDNITTVPDGIYQSPSSGDVVVVQTITSVTQVIVFIGAVGRRYEIRGAGARKVRMISKRKDRRRCRSDNSRLPTLEGYPESNQGDDSLEVEREDVDPVRPWFVYTVELPFCNINGMTWFFLKWSNCGLPLLLKGANVTISGCTATVNVSSTSTFSPVTASGDVTLSPSVTIAGSGSFVVTGATDGDTLGLTSGTSCTGVALSQTVSSGRVSFTNLVAGNYRVCYKSAAAADVALTTQGLTVNPLPVGSPSPSPSPVIVDTDSSSGLSGGAIAGIVVGSVVGGLLLLGALAFVAYKATAKPGGKANPDVEEVEIDESYAQGYSQSGYPQAGYPAYSQSVYAPTPATTPSYVPYY